MLFSTDFDEILSLKVGAFHHTKRSPRAKDNGLTKLSALQKTLNNKRTGDKLCVKFHDESTSYVVFLSEKSYQSRRPMIHETDY